jgi:colanic acid/amylovoran biosynthesis protein
MRVLIEGANHVNKGAEAMLRTVQKELNDRVSDVSFYIERSLVSPETESITENSGVTILDCHPINKFKRKIKLLNLMRQSPTEISPIWRDRSKISFWDTILENIDVIIDISGYRYADPMTSFGARRIAPMVEYARRHKKPYIFLPQAWGPFEKDRTLQNFTHKNCLNSALLFSRDTESRQHLANLLGLPVTKIEQAPDIAFKFTHAGKEAGINLLKQLGVDVGKQPIVCVAPNTKVYERMQGFGANNEYIQLMVDICRDLLKKGVAIVLIPHEIKLKSGHVDDRWLCELIRLATGKSEQIVAVTQPTTAEEIKAAISCSDLLIGSRFHAIIAALQSRVPVVSLGWTHKYQELMKDVGLDKFVVGFENVQSQTLKELIDIAWQEKDSIKCQLEERLPPIENAASVVFDRVMDVIN